MQKKGMRKRTFVEWFSCERAEKASGIVAEGMRRTDDLSQFSVRTAGPLTMTLCLFLREAFDVFTFAVPERCLRRCRGFAITRRSQRSVRERGRAATNRNLNCSRRFSLRKLVLNYFQNNGIRSVPPPHHPTHTTATNPLRIDELKKLILFFWVRQEIHRVARRGEEDEEDSVVIEGDEVEDEAGIEEGAVDSLVAAGTEEDVEELAVEEIEVRTVPHYSPAKSTVNSQRRS